MEVLKIEVLPFQPSQFAPAQSRRHVEKHHGSFPNSRYAKKQLHLHDFENVRSSFALGRDSNARTLTGARDRITVC